MKHLMKIRTFTLLTLLIAVAMTGCKKHIICKKAEGAMLTESLAIAQFDGIDMSIDATVNLTYGEAQSVSVTAQQEVIENLSRDVRGGIWKIDFDQCVRRHDGITIDITIPRITEVEVSGAGNVYGINNFPEQNNLDLRISGSGSIDLSLDGNIVDSKISGSGDIFLAGSATRIQQSISGSGTLSAYDMPVDETDVNISGSGTVRTTVNNTLTVRISGSGDVFYKGNPTIDSNISGSGEVHNAN